VSSPTRPGRRASRLPEFDLAQVLGRPAAPPPARRRGQHRQPGRPGRVAAGDARPRRGQPRPFAGRAPVMPPAPVFRGSTGQIQGLYPWLHGAGMPAAGAYIGVDCLSGGAFACHPVDWLRRGLITNPNLLVTGIPGAGKSATLKALSVRLAAYGVRTLVAGDLKNEYAPLARAFGAEPVELGPGLPARLNPLDAGPLGQQLPAGPARLGERLAEIHRRRITLLAALLEMRLGRGLTPTEEAAISLAIHQATGHAAGATRLADLTIPQVWALLRDPAGEMARELRAASPARLREMIRPTADALGNMVAGSLSGLFDGPTTVRPDFGAPIQTVDLSRIEGRGDETVAMTLACVSSWGQAAIDEPGGPVRLVIRDELWRALRIPAMTRKIDSDLRLSRAHGTIQALATHRLADFEAAAAAGTAEAAIARALISSCDTRICLAQDTGPLAVTRDAIGLTDTECAHIASWSGEQLGCGLWKIGRASSHIVQLILTPAERRLYWTNQKMNVRAARPVITGAPAAGTGPGGEA
jgi:hypothetical protein